MCHSFIDICLFAYLLIKWFLLPYIQYFFIKWTESYIVFILFVFSIHDANKQHENVDRMLYLRMYGTIPQGVGYSTAGKILW